MSIQKVAGAHGHVAVKTGIKNADEVPLNHMIKGGAVMMGAMKKASICMAALGCLLFPALGMSATLEEIDQRLKKLEGEVQINREEAIDAANEAKNKLALSGYASVVYLATDQNDGVLGKVKSGFRIQHLSMFLRKQINNNLRFFSEIEFEDAPSYNSNNAANNRGKILVESVNFDYLIKPEFNLRLGRMYTPAGLWSIDHYPPFVPTQDRPMHIRNIFPQLVDGALVYGTRPLGNAFVNYDLYVGNGESNTLFGGGDNNSSKAAGLKVSVNLPIAQHFELGTTLYRDKLTHDGTIDIGGITADKAAYGFHAKIKEGGFGFQGEYANAKYTNYFAAAGVAPAPVVLTAKADFNRKGYYSQFTYDIGNWTAGYRYDFYNKDTSTAVSSAVADNAVFVNYHVDKNTLLKLEHHKFNEQNPALQDYYRTLATIAVNLD